MRVTVFGEVSGFEGLTGEWETLLSASAADTPFLTPTFQRAWWEALGQGGAFHLVAIRDEQGILVGLAPLYLVVEDGKVLLRLVGGVEVADYLDVIAAPGSEEAVLRALLEHLLGKGAPSWDALDLHDIPAASPSRSYLPRLCAELGLGFSEEVEEVCPAIVLPASWEEYLVGLSKKDRHEVRRKLRRIENEAQVEYCAITGGEGLEGAVADFIALHRASAAEKGNFMEGPMPGFFRRLAQEFARRGWLRLEFLVVNGERVAALFNFDYGGDILVYNSGFDPGRYGHLSMGIVLLSYSLREAIAKGKRCYDFLRGDEEYKYRLGGKNREVYHLVVSRKD